MGPEAKIETTVCNYARKMGVYCRKYTSPAHRSVPDDLFLYKGMCWFIEFKAPGKKATSGQEREIKRIRDQGIQCFVVADAVIGKRIIDGFLL